VDEFVETVGIRRQRDYRFLRTLRTPVATGAGRNLHLFTVAHRPSGELPDDDAIDDVGAFVDRIRYTVMTARPDGELIPVSERPVLLRGSGLERNESFGQAGVAIGDTARRRLRWFYPTGTALELHSESSF
jgi:hypothetical protein